jgi:hypothetical protein
MFELLIKTDELGAAVKRPPRAVKAAQQEGQEGSKLEVGGIAQASQLMEWAVNRLPIGIGTAIVKRVIGH